MGASKNSTGGQEQADTLPSDAVDRQQFLTQTAGDPGLAVEIVQMFRDDRAALFDAVQRAVHEGQAEALERSAHKIRGTLFSLAANGCAGVAARLEAFGRSGNVDLAGPALVDLEHELDRVEAELMRISTELAAETSGR